GDSRTDEVDSRLAYGLLATDGVGEERVAAIDDDVARLEHLREGVDHGIRALTGLHHDDGGAGLREGCCELLVGGGRYELRLGVLVEKRLRLLVRAIEDCDGVALATREVAGEVRSHHREPNNT